eukprot:16059229-Heterocapsa_arctica.AAC.1
MNLPENEFNAACGGDDHGHIRLTSSQRADKLMESPDRASMSPIAYMLRLGKLTKSQIPAGAYRSKNHASKLIAAWICWQRTSSRVAFANKGRNQVDIVLYEVGTHLNGSEGEC